MQNVRTQAVVNIAANVSNLGYLLANGQALQSMKLPVVVEWKQQGQADTFYAPSSFVDKLDDVAPSNIGAQQWVWQQGMLLVTPSGVAMTLRITFDQLSTNIYDPAQNVIRGTGHILAARVASFVAANNNGMGTLQKAADAKAKRSWLMFCKLVVMNQQSKQRSPRPIHRRTWPIGSPVQPPTT